MCHLDHHRKFPTQIIGCAIWILILLEAAKTSNESNQNQIPNYQLRGGPYVERERKSRNVPSLIATLLITDPSSTVRPVFGHESTKRCVLTPKHVENDQTGTVRPVLVD